MACEVTQADWRFEFLEKELRMFFWDEKKTYFSPAGERCSILARESLKDIVADLLQGLTFPYIRLGANVFECTY